MKRLCFHIFLSIFLASSVLSQSYVISGYIEHAEEGQVLLASYFGDRFRVIDSLDTSTGSFYFMLTEENPVGIYRIIYSDRVQGIRSDNQSIEFIFNKKNIEVLVTSGEHGPVAYFEGSVENQVYREFMDFKPNHKLQAQRTHFLDSMSAIYPDLYAIRMMNAFRAPVIPGTLSHQENIDTLQICFFNHATIDDPLLLYAPVYTFRIIDYLSLFKVDTFEKDQQQEHFIEAVDRIMINVSQDQDLRAFVVDFLMEGFELLDMDQVQMHLADQYMDESCEADIVDLVLSRMEGTKMMAPGHQAPDFGFRDMVGKNHQLSKLDFPYVLVMFWSSTCEHCVDMLPEIHEWYLHENSMNMEVVAISIDTSAVNFKIFMESHKTEWITSHDPMGWNGKVPGDYFIYATPTLFLLDQDRTILARPSSFRQFLRVVKKLTPKVDP